MNVELDCESAVGCKRGSIRHKGTNNKGFFFYFASLPLHIFLKKSGRPLISTHKQVRDGDYNVNETVNVVTAKTTEIGHSTWGMVRGVMALATQKVEQYLSLSFTFHHGQCFA
ncbi:hypothetical protein Hanom_Chr12g01153471 [Helianthus anomalus]